MKRYTVLALLAALLSSCNYAGNKSGIHYFLDMHDNLAVEAQEEDLTTLNRSFDGTYLKGADNIEVWSGPGTGLRVPPQGTVPRNYQPYLYESGDFDKAARELKNPLRPTADVLKNGQIQYNRYCSVCHGQLGHGDGPVTPRFPEIPALAGAKSNVLNWEDGRFFHIITVGRARMKPYAAQISPENRWAIIHYIRLLQKQ
jgi:mono/diheme cytochrome c family protein